MQRWYFKEKFDADQGSKHLSLYAVIFIMNSNKCPIIGEKVVKGVLANFVTIARL